MRKAAISFDMSVCLSIHPHAQNNSAPTRRIFMKFYNSGFRKSFEKMMTRIMGILREDTQSDMIISRSVLHRMRSVLKQKM
jgi:hypothetical protein